MIWAEIGLIAGAAFLLAAALAPLESMSWWAGWSNADIEPGHLVDDGESAEPGAGCEVSAPDGAKPRAYIVYLSGIASISGDQRMPREDMLLDRLRRDLPDMVMVADVFPYSPSGAPLMRSPRLFARVWAALDRARLTRIGVLAQLVNMRNLFQVLVSADERYGPVFNFGAAQVIAQAVEDAGFRPGSGVAIHLIGFSGGAQVASGAAAYLKEWSGSRIEVISLGGVIASGPGLAGVDRLHHLYGGRDRVQKLAAVMFPERWRVFRHSAWNRAVAEGRVRRHLIGPMKHAGANGYLGADTAATGQSYLDLSAAAILKALNAPRHDASLRDDAPAGRS